ncbi:hypothetical protein ACYSNR_05085 [Enterococcus sp. LJL128]|uniref:hypothetical protein n=1 Tax=Enterococcus sp. LJL51 TaxID=3416656 RepID=UPI003CFA17C5
MNDFSIYLKNYWHFKQTGTAKKVNGFFYYIKRLPVVGKLIPSSIYQSYGVKEGFAVLMLIFDYLSSFAAKFLWLALHFFAAGFLRSLMVAGNTYDMFSQPTLLAGLFLWLMFVPIFIGFFEGYTFAAEKPLIEFIEQFMQSRTTIIRGNMLLDVCIQGIAYLPAALVYGFLLGRPLETLLFIFISYLSFRVGFLYLGRVIYTWHLSRTKRRLLGTAVTVLVIGIAAAVFFFDQTNRFISLADSWLGNSVLLFFMVGMLHLLLHFKQENEYLLYWIDQATISLKRLDVQKKTNNSYISEGMAMQKKLVISADNQFDHLKGSQYLNALLFSRYRSILNKALRFRFYFIGAALAAVAVASIFGLFKGITVKEITITLPVLFFLMYLMTFGKKVVQMVFVNCDVSMLYYPFYREASTILSGFNYRFKQTFFYNSIVSVGIFSVYLLASLMNSFFLSWDFLAVLALLLAALAALFSFHELFIYYLLQPFTGDMSVVSPLYKIITGVFYWIAYANLQLRFTGFYYAVIVSVLCLIYVGVGFVIIYRKAPKTFRIKA